MKKLILLFAFIFCSILPSSARMFTEEETLIILDASTSMAEKVRGEKKLFFAVNSAKRVLSNLDSNHLLGLRVVGVKITPETIRKLGSSPQLCNQTYLSSPISRNNVENISTELDSLFAFGITPLTYALEQAIRFDFSPDPNTLKDNILITDGGESCGGDPCTLIRRIASQRDDLKVDIIAITVEGEALIQLQCIANASGGNYVPVEDPGDFDQAFTSVITPNTPNLNYKAPTNITPQLSQYSVPKTKSSGILYKNYAFEFKN